MPTGRRRDFLNDASKYYDCVETIQSEISSSFDGFRINADIAQKVVDKFDLETVKIVVANSIQQKMLDGRISRDNKEWARDIAIPIAQHHKQYYVVDGNAGLLNIVSNQFRRLEREQEKPSVKDQLSALKADTVLKSKPVKSKEMEVR